MEITRSRPATQAGSAQHFTGSVWLDEIAAPPAPSRLRMFSVHFAPGARTAWHRHPHGQVLHVTEGEGRVGREGGAVEVIRAGDTVWIAPGERHWHGAGPHTFMTHLPVVEAADDGATAAWEERVDEGAYLAA
ncbi:cupin domain-containing protein [Streptomyces sp. NPDC003077]|uniref:(R)-mandelonitrile lyase n=1 Tax=Streptomyces sp. NPDC003077 TaxID=3154443 RepID=UPI0033A29CAC